MAEFSVELTDSLSLSLSMHAARVTARESPRPGRLAKMQSQQVHRGSRIERRG
jgi:hypothetical protein